MLEKIGRNRLLNAFISGAVATVIFSSGAKAIKVRDGASTPEIVGTLQEGAAKDPFESGVLTLSSGDSKENKHVLGSFEGGEKSIDKKELDIRINEIKRLYRESKQSFKSLVLYHNHTTKSISKISGKSEEEVKKILLGSSPGDIYAAINLQRELQKSPELKDLKFISVVVESGGSWIMSSKRGNNISDEDFRILMEHEYPNYRFNLAKNSLNYFKNPTPENENLALAMDAIRKFNGFLSNALGVTSAYIPHSEKEKITKVIEDLSR